MKLKFQTESSCGAIEREDTINLFDADSEDEARLKATAFGNSEQYEMNNESGITTRWRFIEVGEVIELWESELVDGMEVYSILHE